MADKTAPTPDGFAGVLRLRFTLVYAALFLPFAVATPYLQVLLRLRGFQKDAIGWIQGTLEAMAVLAPPVWGWLSDRSGKRRLFLALGVAGCVPTFLLFGVVKAALLAIAVAVLFGFCYRPLIPLTDGITFRYIGERGGDYGLVRIGGSISFIVCTLTLESLGIARSGTGAMILAAMCVACGLQFLCVALLPRTGSGHAGPADPSAAAGGMSAFLRRPFVLFMLCAFLGRLAMMSYYGFFSLYLKEVHGFSKAGLVWWIGPLSEIPVIYFSQRIMKRIGVRNLFALGLVGISVRLLGFAVAPARALWAVVPFQLLHSLTFGAYHCASVTYVSRVVPARLHSTAQTVFAAVTVGLGGIIGGGLGGWVAEQYGFTALYGGCGAVALIALVVLLVWVPPLSVPEPEG
ncbi:MAG: MFS transporter [Kiritimatiellae bacterium]|nr:MFS transporter [Kiritimatiellia bacterium]